MAKANWHLWQTELRDPTPEERRADRSTDGHAMTGYWRMAGPRTGVDWPVVIWTEDGKSETILQIGRKMMNTVEHETEWHEFVGKAWLKCTAVSQAAWNAAMDAGRWADGRPARQLTDDEKLAHTVDLIPDTPADEGGNADGGPSFDEQIDAKMKAEIAKHAALGKIDTMEKAGVAATILESIQALGKLGNARREADRLPHLNAAAKVQGLWLPILTPGSELVPKIKDEIEAFKRAEKARLQKIADDAAEAERQRLQKIADDEAEVRRAALQRQLDEEAAQRGVAAEDAVIEAETIVVEAETVAAPRVSTTFGRAVSSPKIKTATIIDAKALALHLVDTKDADLFEYLGKRANAAARAKITLPGCEINS